MVRGSASGPGPSASSPAPCGARRSPPPDGLARNQVYVRAPGRRYLPRALMSDQHPPEEPPGSLPPPPEPGAKPMPVVADGMQPLPPAEGGATTSTHRSRALTISLIVTAVVLLV